MAELPVKDEKNVFMVFKALDRVEAILAGKSPEDKSTNERDYLLGSGRGVLTEADIRLYATIARFDAAYFHC
jgi:glutathionyl-hydroquinone reductase